MILHNYNLVMYMKRLFSLIFAVVLVFSCTFTLAPSVYSADEYSDSSASESFASEIGSMMQDSSKIKLKNDYELCRLIVKSDTSIDFLDATKVIEAFDGIRILEFPSLESTENAFNYYSSLESVEFVETDKLVNAIAATQLNVTTAQDKDYLSWAPEYINIPPFIDLLESLSVKRNDVTVAVLDTGVQSDHQKLAGRVIPTNINTSTSGTRNSSEDDNGHGTQVAGAIIDSTSECVKVRAYKVMDCYGNGTTTSAAAGIICAINDGVDIINMSFGFYENSPILELAVKKAHKAGILIVGAAGNNATSNPFYPADYAEVLKISAINEKGNIANFSNYGNVDFAAPGVDIYTTNYQNSYIKTDGTSIAAPFVSALAAEILSTIPDSSPEEITQILINNSLNPQTVYDNDYYGNGILFAPEADPDGKYAKGKTAPVTFSHSTAIYHEPIELSLFCETENSEIYYSTDYNYPSKYDDYSIKYESPILIDKPTILNAVAYSDNKFRSIFSTVYILIAPYAAEEDFTVSADGTVTSYSGTMLSFTVPDTVNGITVTAIGEKVFKDKPIKSVILPDSVTKIGESAFENCNKLYYINALSVSSVGNRAFYGCTGVVSAELGDIREIGSYSFADMGSAIYSLDGTSLSFNLKNITAVPEGAFKGSAISSIDVIRLDSIGTNAFSGCDALASVIIGKITQIPNAVFKECISLKDVHIDGLLTIPREAFSGCKALKHVSIPDATFVNANAFNGCEELTELDIPMAQMIYNNAFVNCKSIISLSLPEMTSFDPTVSNVIIPQLPPNLVTFYAPKLQTTAISMFLACKSSIKYIFLNSVTKLAEDTFRACEKIEYVYLPKLTEINVEGFTNCKGIRYMDLQNLESSSSFPDNSGVLLSNKFKNCACNANNLTVYGTKGSSAEAFAANHNHRFIEVPYIYNTLPKNITAESETVSIFCVGFNLTYQWYYSEERNSSEVYAVEGANSSGYTFTPDDPKGFYYCEITQNDNGIVSSFTTPVMVKDNTPADYTAYNEAVARAGGYNLNNYYNGEKVAEALAADVSGLYSIEQEIVDKQTGIINEALASIKLKTPKSLYAWCKKTNLHFLESTTIIPDIYPEGAVYRSLVFTSSDNSVVRVSKNGRVTCIGDGTATVTVTLTLNDGSVLSVEKDFTCKLTKFEKVISILFRIFILLYL